MKNILITGGTGFFGKALLKYLAEGNRYLFGVDHVYVLSRDPKKFLENSPQFTKIGFLSFIKGDILLPASLPLELQVDSLIHAAADSTLGPTLAPIERFEQIVTGTRNILNYAASIGVKRFLFTSSGAVYGSSTSPRSSETSVTLPDTNYGFAKLTAEHLCELFRQQHNMETVVARCFAFVGPDLPIDAHFAIGNFIRDALWRPEIVVQGDGTAVRSYLYQDDLARWLLKLLDQGQSGLAYNVGSSDGVSVAELAHLVRDILAPEKPVRILGDVSEGLSSTNYVPEISRIHQLHGLCVQVRLREAIQLTAECLQANIKF